MPATAALNDEVAFDDADVADDDIGETSAVLLSSHNGNIGTLIILQSKSSFDPDPGKNWYPCGLSSSYKCKEKKNNRE